MSIYISFHNHSDFSILDGLSKSADIVKRAVELKMPAIGISDHYVVSGLLPFYKDCKKAGIKPILGCEFGISPDDSSIKENNNRKLNHLCVYARNEAGVYDLFEAITESNEQFYYAPRLDIDRWRKYGERDNLFATSACIQGVIAAKLFDDFDAAVNSTSVEECESHLCRDWLDITCEETLKWARIFNNNFYLEAMIEGLPSQIVALNCFRELSKKSNTILLASSDSHFPDGDSAIVHECLICSQVKQTLAQRQADRSAGKDVIFSDNSRYYIHSYEEMEQNFTDEELKNTLIIDEIVEDYELDLGKPRLPLFPLPDGSESREKFFVEICKNRLMEMGKADDAIYIDRMNKEYQLFSSIKADTNATLLDYFLIIWDIVQEIERRGHFTPIGRGSASGALTAYLLGICKIDAVKYGLSQERFYNSGRMTEDRISLPDIDLDVPVEIRDDIINYLKNKYGEDNVAQISTFNTMGPKAAIKEAFRVHGIEFEKANLFTKMFPESDIKHDESAHNTIEDAMALSEEFRTSLEPYRAQVETAKRLQGVVKAKGIHAAGIVIADKPLRSFLPLVYDAKSKRMVVGLEMHDCEELGGVKFDLLGLKLISTIDTIRRSIKMGVPEIVGIDNTLMPFREAVKKYFIDGGYNMIEEGEWFVFQNSEKFGDKNLYILPYEDSHDLFKEDNEIVHVFHASCDLSNSFIFTASGNDVYVHNMKNPDEVEYLKPFGKFSESGEIMRNGKI